MSSSVQLKCRTQEGKYGLTQYHSVVHGSMWAFAKIEHMQRRHLALCDCKVENHANFRYRQPEE